MPESANSTDLAADERALAEHAGRLADGVEAALPGWVVRSVTVVADAWRPGLGDELQPAAGAAGTAAVAESVPGSGPCWPPTWTSSGPARWR